MLACMHAYVLGAYVCAGMLRCPARLCIFAWQGCHSRCAFGSLGYDGYGGVLVLASTMQLIIAQLVTTTDVQRQLYGGC